MVSEVASAAGSVVSPLSTRAVISFSTVTSVVPSLLTVTVAIPSSVPAVAVVVSSLRTITAITSFPVPTVASISPFSATAPVSPVPAAAPVTPPGVWRAVAGRSLVPVLGVRTVPAEVSPLATLVAPHAGVPAPPALPSGSWPRHRYPHPPPAYSAAVSIPAGRQRVPRPAVDNEGEAGNTLGHPDLLQRTKVTEHLLQVPLAGRAVQVGDVEPHSLLFLGPGPRPGPRPGPGPGPGAAGAGPRAGS